MSGKKFYAFLSASALALMIAATGCDKNKDDNNELTVTSDISYAKENARIEQILNDAQTFTDQAFAGRYLNLKGGSILGSGCASIIVDTAARSVTVDFGGKDCLCKDSRYRKGKITRIYSGNYNDSGALHNIKFSDYYVNDYRVDGKITIAVKKTPAKGLYYEMESDVVITAPDGATTTRTANQVRSFVKGTSSADVYDDEYYIDGYGVYTHPDGSVFKMNIEQHIRVNPNCDWPLEGIVELTPINGFARVMDYGPVIGCDNKVIFTVDKKVYEILLD